MESTEEAASPQAGDRPGEGLMINNQSVQKIDEAGHLQENDGSQGSQPQLGGAQQQTMNGNYSNGNVQSSSAAFGMGYPAGNPDEMGTDLHYQEQEDLDAIIESISYGKTQQIKKLQFQAFTAAIAHEDQVKFVMDYLNNVNNTTHSKFPTARNRILAYRVAQLDQISQREVMAEGFDDDGEDGAGEKLLHLLQKMEIENIVLIVCIWNNGVQIGSQQIKGGEFFRIVVERGRELLNQIQEQIYQEEIDKLQMTVANVQGIDGAIIGQGQTGPGGVTMSKRRVDGSLEAPTGPRRLGKKPQKGGLGVVGSNAANSIKVKQKGSSGIDEIDQKIFQHFKQDLSEKDFESAQNEIELALKELTKANVIELRQIAKPHHLIEKTLQIVAALRGYKNLNWTTARDLLGRSTLKVDLKQTNYLTIKSEDVLRAQNILVQKTNTMLTPENVQIHSQGAALLLVWAANIIKQYAAYKWVGEDLNKQNEPYTNYSPDKGANKRELQQITIETKIALRQQKRAQNEEFLAAHKKKVKDSDDEDLEDGEDGEEDLEKRQARMERLAEKEKDKQRNKTKIGVIGHFISSKPMIISPDGSRLIPEKGDGQPKKLIDYNVVKKGAFADYHNKGRRKDQVLEDQYLTQEEDRLGKAAKEEERLKKIEDAKKRDQKEQKIEKQKEIMKGGEKKKEPEPEGKLRMNQVQSLPDDVDEVIKQLNETDFQIQDLDVLIELSKQLKTKRQVLFPDTSYLFNLQNAGLSNDQIDEVGKIDKQNNAEEEDN